MWNSTFTGVTADTTTGFFSSAQGLHFLFNNGATLPMAWAGFTMDFSNNFDLDYSNNFGSNFRANVTGWQSAEFTTYSSAISVNPVPVPAAVWLFGTALIGLIGFGKRVPRQPQLDSLA